MASENNGNVAVLDEVVAEEEVSAAPAEDTDTDVDITGTAEVTAEKDAGVEHEELPEETDAEAPAADDDMLDSKTADPETYIGNHELKKDLLKLRDMAERLFGHSSKVMDYVNLAFFTRELHLKQANLDLSKGREFKRADWVEQVSVLIKNTTTVPPAMNDPSLWLQIVGLICLVRGRFDQELKRWTPNPAKPTADWFEGNLNWATMKALAPMVNVEKGNGADTYSFKEGCDQIAVDMVDELKRSLLPNSDSYVRRERENRVKKAQLAIAKKKAASLSPEAAAALEQQEISRKHKANYDKVFKAADSLTKLRNEVNFTPERLRSQLIDQGVIPPVSTSDLVGLMATPANRTVANAAILSNVETRKAFLAELSKDITHQDVQELFNGLLMRVKANPADKAAKLALNAFRTAAAKLTQQPQQHAN